MPDTPASATLPDGGTFSFADAAEQIYRKLQVRTRDGKARTFELDYKASGSDIFCLHAGPDGCVYGSSYLPLHLFRYNPTQGGLVDLGRCSAAAGEAYSMANFEGKIYISAYPAARLSVYDPAKPYRFGNSPADNPRGPDQGRFRVFRGGGWHTGPGCVRVFYRNALPANWRDFNVGFRCAKDVD